MKKGKRVLAGFLAVLLVATSFVWDFGETKAAGEEGTAVETLNNGEITFDDINVADLDSQGYSSTKFTDEKVVAGEIDKAPSEHWFSGDGQDTPYGTSTPASKNIGIKPNTANDADRYFLYTPYSYEDFRVSTEIYYGAFSGIVIGEKNVYPTIDGTGSSITIFFNGGRINIMGAVDYSTATITRGIKARKAPNGDSKGYAIFNNGDGDAISGAKGKVYTLNVMKQGNHLTVWISGGKGVMTIDITDTYKTGWIGLQSRGYHRDCGGFKSLKVTKINAIEKQNFENINMQELDDLGYTTWTDEGGNTFGNPLDSTSSAWFSGKENYPSGTVLEKHDGLKTKFTGGSTTLNTPYVYENFRLKVTVNKGQVIGVVIGKKGVKPKIQSSSTEEISIYINQHYLDISGAVQYDTGRGEAGVTGTKLTNLYRIVPKNNSQADWGAVRTLVVELKNGELSVWQEGYDGVARIKVADTYKTENIALFQRQFTVNSDKGGGAFISYEICNLDAGDAQNFDNVNLSNLSAAGYTGTRYGAASGNVHTAEGAVSNTWFSGQTGYAADKTVEEKNDGLKTCQAGTDYLTTLNIPHAYENFRLKTTVYKGQVIGIVIGKKGVAPRIDTASASEISIYINEKYLAISGAIQENTRIVNEGVAGTHSSKLFQVALRKNGIEESKTAWGEERTIVMEVQNGILSVWYEGYDDVARIQVADSYTTENIALFQRRYDSNGGGFKSYEIEKLSDTNIGTTVDLEGYTDFDHVNADVLDAKGFTSARVTPSTGETEVAAKVSDHWFAGELGKSAKVAVSSNNGLKPNIGGAASEGTYTILNTPYKYTNFRVSVEMCCGSQTGVILGEKNVLPTENTNSVRIYFNVNANGIGQFQITGGGVDYRSALFTDGVVWNFGSAPTYIFKPTEDFKSTFGDVCTLNVEMKNGVLSIWVDGDEEHVLSLKTTEKFNSEVIALTERKYDDNGGLKSLQVEELKGDIVKQYTANDFAEYRSGENRAPQYKNYLFAGWFTDEACTPEGAVKLDAKTVEGTVYAKFIPKYVLGVRAQVSNNLTNTDSTDNEKGAIRFVTTIDTLHYSKVGFLLSYDKGNDNKVVDREAASNKVYTKLYASAGDIGSQKIEYTPSDYFCNASTYFKACTVTGIPEEFYDMKFTVIPFYQTLDGTVVKGDSVVRTVTQGINYVALEKKTALFVGDSIQCGNNYDGSTNDLTATRPENVEKQGRTLAAWSGRLERDYGIISENLAQKGWTLTNKDISDRNQIVTELESAKSKTYDFVILEGGVNDVLLGIPWGKIDPHPDVEHNDTTTIAGAMQNLIEQTMKKFQHSEIVYIINHYFHATPANMERYVNMVKEACTLYGIRYVDLSDIEKYPTLEPLTKQSDDYLKDDLHPTPLGYELSTPVIATYLRKLLTGEVADTVYVSATGTDAMGYGTSDKPYKTLNYAVNQVENNGTVYVNGTMECGPNNENAYFLGGNKKDIVATNTKQVTIKGIDEDSLLDFSKAQMLCLNMAVTLEKIQVKWSSVRVHAEGNRFLVADTVVQTADSNTPGMYGGSLSHNVDRTDIKLYAGSYRPIVGGQTQGTVGETHVTVGGNVNPSVDTTCHDIKMGDGAQNLFGGSFALTDTDPTVSGNTYVTVESGPRFNYVYGGGGHADDATKGSVVQGTTHVEFAGDAYSLYGGGWIGAVEGGTNVKITGGRVAQVFGGNERTDMTGNTNVQILGGTILRRVYGGNYNEYVLSTGTWKENSKVTGNTCVTIGGNANLLLNQESDQGLGACSRIGSNPECEIGTVILQDGRDEPKWASGFSYARYHYLVKAGINGKVWSKGDTIYVVPDAGYTATVTSSDGTTSSLTEAGDYKLPELGSATSMEINVAFTKQTAE